MTATTGDRATTLLPAGGHVVVALLRRTLEHQVRRPVDLRAVAEVPGRPAQVIATDGAQVLHVPWPGEADAGALATAVRHRSADVTTSVEARAPAAVDWSAVTDELRAAGAVLSTMLTDRLELERLRQDVADLTAAMRSRAVIDQALGVVMAHRRCPAGPALELVKTLARQRNEKVSTVAARIVAHAGGGEPAAGPAFVSRRHPAGGPSRRPARPGA